MFFRALCRPSEASIRRQLAYWEQLKPKTQAQARKRSQSLAALTAELDRLGQDQVAAWRSAGAL